jgi:hypothetical protein
VAQTRALKPVNLRLPQWAVDYVDRRAASTGATKTQTVIEAISCLRAREVQDLMREGYEEMRDLNRQMAEEGVAAAGDCLPGW